MKSLWQQPRIMRTCILVFHWAPPMLQDKHFFRIKGEEGGRPNLETRGYKYTPSSSSLHLPHIAEVYNRKLSSNGEGGGC